MEKIISLFKRNYESDRLVRDELTEGAEWVVNNEGIATRKYDGTCCLIRDGKLFKRYDAKSGKKAPVGFEPSIPLPDCHTGHWPGWLPVGTDPSDTYHREAFDRLQYKDDGTYELCGPKVQGNPEKFPDHTLIKHGIDVIMDCPRTFVELKAYLSEVDIEGIVWWHPSGKKVKIKGKDFGIKRVAKR